VVYDSDDFYELMLVDLIGELMVAHGRADAVLRRADLRSP